MPWPFRKDAGTEAAVVMQFPNPLGGTSGAARLPWRLPDEPALAGIAADAASVGDLAVRAASLVGPGHRCAEPALPRQDAYRLGRDTGKRHLIVAVADGMSDSSCAHLGANVAVTAIVGRIRADLDQAESLDAELIFLDAARQMAGAAEQQGVTPDDVRAAALAAVIPVSPDEFGRRAVWLATLADVSAWTRCTEGWQRLTGDEKAELDVGRLVEFLPFHPDRARGITVTLERDAVLALTTDGLGDVLGAGDALAPWFADRWKSPPHITAFVEDVGFEAAGRLDDRTAVVIWCAP